MSDHHGVDTPPGNPSDDLARMLREYLDTVDAVVATITPAETEAALTRILGGEK